MPRDDGVDDLDPRLLQGLGATHERRLTELPEGPATDDDLFGDNQHTFIWVPLSDQSLPQADTSANS